MSLSNTPLFYIYFYDLIFPDKDPERKCNLRNVDPELLRLVDEKKVSIAQIMIAFMTMSDRPQCVDLGIIHGLSEGMYRAASLLDHAVNLYLSNVVNLLAIVGGDGSAMPPNTEPRSAWVGQEWLLQELNKRSIDASFILKTAPIRHSKDEAVQTIRLAKERGFKTIGSISVAYHSGRTLPYTLAAMKEESYFVSFHTLPPPCTDWWSPVLGSQGLTTVPQARSIIDDALKIEEHIKKGFAAPFPEVLHYLLNREEIVKTQRFDYEE